MTIIAGTSPGSREFAESLAKVLGMETVHARYKVFPDGESYVRIEKDGLDSAIIVQTMSKPQNSALVEAMFLADAAKGLGARRIVLIAPYMAYARQDKRFLHGEPVSIAVVLRALYYSGYRELYTVEIHKEEALSAFPGKAVSVYPYEYMIEKIGINGDYVLLAPDVGALRRVERLAKKIGAQYDYLIKKRDRVTGEIIVEPKHLKVKEKKVVIVDDIISTGGTVSKATKLLLDQGAVEVYVMVAHALLAGNALERLEKAGVSKVYATNSLPPKDAGLVEYIDIAPLLAEEISKELGKDF
ncbi:MAG: ribose-phosphate pyrophosphokinase [Desulfurococcales archaeon]|nr:ribose-phosphate pyrophosphokinase [Desulfurococcales archaeon]